MDIIRKAQNEKESDNISGTQFDSYGALIFFNGGLVYSFIADPSKDMSRQKFFIESFADNEGGRHKGWTKAGIPEGTGTEWAKMLRDEIKSGAWGEIPKQGFCLIVFNAAFYSALQEAGRTEHYALRKKYKILSMVNKDLQELRDKFKGSTLRGHKLPGLD